MKLSVTFALFMKQNNVKKTMRNAIYTTFTF